MDEFDQTKQDIEELVARAQEVVVPKITPVNKIIDDIKVKLAHGTDTIPTSQIQEWALSLSVILTELTPYKEAYALSSALWKLDISKSNATTLAERRAEQKKVDIENQNIISNSDKEIQKAILDYMSSMIRTTQDNVFTMCSELNRILDARTRFGENKNG